jgi:hypothetical protein
MTPEQIAAIIDQSSKELARHYVFPEIGEQLSALIAQRSADGHYAQAGDAAQLSALVTTDLQSINDDRHLRLKYHQEELPDLPSHDMMVAQARRDAARQMGGIGTVARLAGNVALLELGPLLFAPDIAGDSQVAAMNLVASAQGLILDVRGLFGGSPEAVMLLCSYLFDGAPVHLNDMYHRDGDVTTQSWTMPFVPGNRYGGTKPIAVVTSAATFSGGEELSYDLQQLGRATVVGERTGGGAHPRIGVRVHPHLELTVPTGRAINPVTGTNWEGTGVVPDIEVAASQAVPVALDVVTGRR